MPTRRHDDENTPKRTRRLSAADAATAAVEQLTSLIAKQPMSVTSVEPAEKGWLVGIETVEERRVPATSDMLALYQVELDAAGRLRAYRRTQRYLRGRPNGKEAS
ncbi:MAG TPA: gas vesicle protein GvpO [Pseudonocardiaceae bacterium]|nr:gas vesicle protein GvpO [Pseudonocardiaceae bacterium]